MLKGKTALVTGSTSGIGLGIAKALARQGANIVLNGFGDVDGPRAEVLAAGEAAGAQVAYHGADMSRVADIEDMMKYSASQFGRVDILINNAGIQHVANVENFPVERWDSIIAINLTSAFHTSRLALPAMKSANWGRIINVASVHGLVGSAQKSAYVAAKHGVVGLTKVVALETAGTGGVKRLIAYANETDAHEFHLPGGGHEFGNVWQKGPYSWEVPGVMNIGGYDNHVPKAKTAVDIAAS